MTIGIARNPAFSAGILKLCGYGDRVTWFNFEILVRGAGLGLRNPFGAITKGKEIFWGLAVVRSGCSWIVSGKNFIMCCPVS